MLLTLQDYAKASGLPVPSGSQFAEVSAGKGCTDAADGGTPRQTPAQVVDTALRVLDRKNPPPSVVSGRRNQIMALGGRFLSRRLLVSLLGRMTGQAQQPESPVPPT